VRWWTALPSVAFRVRATYSASQAEA